MSTSSVNHVKGKAATSVSQRIERYIHMHINANVPGHSFVKVPKIENSELTFMTQHLRFLVYGSFLFDLSYQIFCRLLKKVRLLQM
jgi:hypothetical protein